MLAEFCLQDRKISGTWNFDIQSFRTVIPIRNPLLFFKTHDQNADYRLDSLFIKFDEYNVFWGAELIYDKDSVESLFFSTGMTRIISFSCQFGNPLSKSLIIGRFLKIHLKVNLHLISDLQGVKIKWPCAFYNAGRKMWNYFWVNHWDKR